MPAADHPAHRIVLRLASGLAAGVTLAAAAEEAVPLPTAGGVRAWVVVSAANPPDATAARTAEEAGALADQFAARGASVFRTSGAAATRLELLRGWLRLGLASRTDDTLLVYWVGPVATARPDAARPDLLLVPSDCPAWTADFNGLSLDAWAESSALFPARHGVIWLCAQLPTNAASSRLTAPDPAASAGWRLLAAAANFQPLENGPRYSRFAGGLLDWLRTLDSLADAARTDRLSALERRLRIESDGRQTPVARVWTSDPPPSSDPERLQAIANALRTWAEHEPVAFDPLPGLMTECLDVGLPQTAFALGRAGLDLAANDSQRRSAWMAMAEADAASGRQDRAQQWLQQALDTTHPPPDAAAALWYRKGQALMATDHPAGEIEAFQQALRMAREAGDATRILQADCLRELARLAEEEGHSFNAASYLNEEIELRRKASPSDPSSLANALDRLARNAHGAGNMEAALRLSAEALDAWRTAGLAPADALWNRARWLIEAGKAEDAEALLADLERQAAATTDVRRSIDLAMELGNLRLRLGRFEDARQTFYDGLTRAAADPSLTATPAGIALRVGLGHALRGLRKNEEAAAELRRALDALDEAADPGQAAALWQELGEELEAGGHTLDSLSACQRAAALWQRAGTLDPATQAVLFLRLARLQCALHNAPRAARFAERALEELARAGATNTLDLAVTSTRVGAALTASGETDRALSWAQRGLDLLPGDAPEWGAEREEAQRVLFDAQESSGRIETALATARSALAHWETVQPPDDRALAGWLRHIAALEVRRKNPDEAVAAYAQALAHLAGGNPADNPEFVATLLDLGRLLNDYRRYDETLRWLEPLYRRSPDAAFSPLDGDILSVWSQARQALNPDSIVPTPPAATISHGLMDIGDGGDAPAPAPRREP